MPRPCRGRADLAFHTCVRDARPQGRDPAAVGNGGIVAYGARSPVWRLGAKHAQALLFQSVYDERSHSRPTVSR
jgi:hypothetical protein